MPDAPRGFQPDDLYRIKTVTEPQISPDGARVAFVVTEINREENGYRSAIWLVNADGSGARPITAGSKSDGQPRWSPDGKALGFTSNRDGRQQLYLLPLDGGEPRRLTTLPQGVLEYAFSPDGQTIAFTSRTGVSEEKDAAQQPRVITTLKHKFNGQGFTQGRRHLFVVPAAGGEPRQLTDGDYDDAQIAWSADGNDILFVSARHANRDRDQGQDLWRVPAAGGEARPLTEGFGVVNVPVVGPDGASIAVVGHDEARDLGARPASIWLLGAKGARPRNLLAGLDRGVQAGAIAPGAPPARIAWADGGAAILARIQDGAAVELRRIAVADGALTTLAGGQRVVEAFSVANDGTIACTISDPEHPAEVYLIDRDGRERRLSSINDEFVASLRFPEIAPVRAISADGTPVEGWVIKPLEMQPGVRYPLVLNIHGGPHGAFLYNFRAGYPLTLSALGCAVLEMNPRGSTGWGEEFARALHGGRGEWDLPDLMAGVDAVIAEGWVDPERLGITGYSYGGYMTAWGITQTDRFKAAVWGAGTANLYVHFAYSDINVPRYAEMKGSPWEQRETYLRQSPISYVQNVTTPLLMLHGEADLRCNIAQAEEFFTALKYFDKEVVFVRYPGEHHMMPNSGKPSNRVDYMRRTVDWFRERLALDAGPTRTEVEREAATAAGE
jgi:dipeptidyl aminopeptidase/acylaminoacyl peptidase